MKTSWPGSSRAQTADGGTVIDFLDDVMQDRVDGFKPHHRIAAAKELIVHIVRDEAPESVPGDTSVSVSAQAPSSVRAEPVLSDVEGACPEHRRRIPARNQQLETRNPPCTTAPKTTHPNTTAPGWSRQGRHSQEGPGVRAQQGGRRARKARARGAHPRRAQNQGKAQGALARAGPQGRTHRLHNTRPLTTLVTPTRLHN